MALNNSNEKLSLKAGSCDDGFGGRVCEFEKSSCDDPSSWSSSREMIGAPYNAHGGSCLLAGTVREMSHERCGHDNVCAPNADSCWSKSSFPDDTCTTESIRYGACKDLSSGAARCSWSPDDCVDDEVWDFPHAGCAYNDVRVGGCEYNGMVSCAVSQDGCDAESVWLGPLDLTIATGKECYLGNYVEEAPESDPVVVAPQETPANNNENNNDSSNSAVVAIIATIGALLVVVVAVVLLVQRRNNRSAESISKPPAESLEISSYSQEGDKKDEDDAVSQLGEEDM